MGWEDRFRELASTQEGLIARFHLDSIEGTATHWWRAKQSDRWEVLSPRVLRVRGAPESDTQRALAAVLDASPGAVLHGQSALGWFGLGRYHLRNLTVARPYGMSGAAPALSKLHSLRDFRSHHVVVARGVPTETPLRAIWVEAARYAAPARVDLGYAKIGRLLDAAHRRGLVTWAALQEMVDDIHERGRSGTVMMRALAEARPPGSSPTESRNEDRMEKILANAGVPHLRRQVVLGGHEPIGRVDFCDSDVALAVEVNSLTFHTAPTDRTADEVRYRRLNDAGFTVAVIWEDDLWSQPREVVRIVTAARRHARAKDCVVLHSRSCPFVL